MYRSGDIVVRLTEPVEGEFRAGTRAIVKEVLNDKEFTLEGHVGIYLQSSFRPDTLVDSHGQIRHMSDLEAVENALNIIDNWNRTHPTAYMISIEAEPAQDGGSIFSTTSEDTNSIPQFMSYLAIAASDNERKATLRKAMDLMQLQLGD